MGRTKFKTHVRIVAVFVWAISLACAKILKDTFLVDPASFWQTSQILLIYLSVPIFFIWLTLDIPFGLPAILVSSVFTILLFSGNIAMYAILFFFIAAYFGHKLNGIFETKVKNLEVDNEKMEEKLNLLHQGIKAQENDNSRIRNSLQKISHLKNIIEDYSQALSTDDITESIVQNSFELLKNANRVLLYMVDTEQHELKLVKSKKRDTSFVIKAKKGDVFDRWVLRHRMPLLVNDIKRDFRFSTKEELDKGFNSLISSLLISEHKILGVLRVDSTETSKFTQSDLRFLDIIAGLSSVSLQNSMLYERVEDLAIHDSLTGLYVHKYFVERLEEEVKRSLRNNMDLSLLMLDLDNFKIYNDEHGHNAGDLVLKHVASTIKAFTGSGDIIARYGGEEFTVLLLGRDKKAAEEIAQKIRRSISETPLVLRRKKTPMTVSIGVATCPSESRIANEFLRLVDSRLYKAKEKGRNKVCAK